MIPHTSNTSGQIETGEILDRSPPGSPGGGIASAIGRRLVDGLAVVGAGSLIAAGVVGGVLWWEICHPSQSRDGSNVPADRVEAPVSPVAEQIASQLAPTLQALALSNRETIIAESGGPMTRLTVRAAFPAGVRAIPHATRVGCDLALTYLDGLSVSQLIALLTEHARAKRSEPTESALISSPTTAQPSCSR